MRVDIIIPTYGQEEHTVRCFESLRRHTDNYRLVWVDDGSSLESKAVVMGEAQAHSDVVTMWLPKNGGFIKAVNAGLSFATRMGRSNARLTAVLNNDIMLTDGWLDRMRRTFVNNDHVYALGPVTSECSSWQSYLNVPEILPSFRQPPGFLSMSTVERAKALASMYGGLMMPCRMLAFFCTVFRTDVFDRIGFLDERFDLGYGDDDDLCFRMGKAGMKCGLSMGTYVFHQHRATFGSIYTPEEIKATQRRQLERFREKHGEDARVV